MEADNFRGRVSEEFRGRTKEFAALGVRIYRELPRVREVDVLGHQMLRAATSVAANVREASRARSNDEFIAKLGIALQEADEAQLWLELLREECNVTGDRIEILLRESHEIIAILVTIIKRIRG
jgi:four helix bundle protein